MYLCSNHDVNAWHLSHFLKQNSNYQCKNKTRDRIGQWHCSTVIHRPLPAYGSLCLETVESVLCSCFQLAPAEEGCYLRTGTVDKFDIPQPHPLPMPEYGGYFAPLTEYLPDSSQPISGFHRYVILLKQK
jgi:hypothetical protein